MSDHFVDLLGQEPEALLFDLDGTLVDSVPDIAVAVDAMLQDLERQPVGEPQVRQWVGNGALKLVERALAHSFDCEEDAVSREQLNAAHQYFLRHYEQSNGQYSRLYPGVIEALTIWAEQSLPMAIVTNKPIQFVPHLLANLGIADFFGVRLGGECVPQKKPHPGMLFAACDLLGARPRHCMMIGDSRNDIAAARAAQMPVIAVNYGYNHGRPVAQENPDRVIADLRELLATTL